MGCVGSSNDGADLGGYEQGSRRSGSPQVFANSDAAETWFAENDPEGVAFEYDVLEGAAN
jgi:hypothetical protein